MIFKSERFLILFVSIIIANLAKSEPIDPCSSNPCQNSGTCKTIASGYNCTCTTDFYGDNCQIRKP